MANIRQDEVDEGVSKRIRTLDLRQATSRAVLPPMSDLLKRTLASLEFSDSRAAGQTEIPVPHLESMAAKIAALEDALNAKKNLEAGLAGHAKSLETQLRSHEHTLKTLQVKFMEALRDRGTYESQCKTAENDAKTAKNLLEVIRADAQSSKDLIKSLETQLAEAKTALATSSNTDAAQLARMEKDLEAALSKVHVLEKKNSSLQNELEYSRTAYQTASNSFTEANKEVQELKREMTELERRAGNNLVAMQEMVIKSQRTAEVQQMKQLQAILEERERELERVREELLKVRNGRRETRQASVPRSPRPMASVMSPRPGRGVGGGTGSRGTSPAPTNETAPLLPGTAFFTQPPGRRWGHLQD